MCHGCQQSIDDEFRLYIAPDMNWHIACLLCSECHTSLSERETCIIHDGRPYCRTDYIRLVLVGVSIMIHRSADVRQHLIHS